jgi:uncharacterized metal-binding protein YceD (DUF177 family)
LDFDLEDSYFKALDGSELNHGALHVSVSIRKAIGFFELLFHTEGTVTVTCDRCLDDMSQPIKTDNRLIVKLGAVNSEEDDIIIVSEDEGILDLSWIIYEFIVLAIPIKHVHAPGKCNPAMSQVLEELSADRSSNVESAQPIDPRWSKLAELNIKD